MDCACPRCETVNCEIARFCARCGMSLAKGVGGPRTAGRVRHPRPTTAPEGCRLCEGTADLYYRSESSLGGAALLATEGVNVLVFGRALNRLESGELTIETDGPARYAVRLVLARKEDRSAGVDNGFEVEREYVDPDSGEPLTGFAVGDLVRIKLRVTTTHERHYAAVVDPLPAGFEAVNTRLATSAQEYRNERPRHSRWYWKPGWTHTELRDDRVLAFADLMDPGTLELEYLARATSPGSFTAAPAHAEVMYEPEVNGRTAARQIEVRP